MAKVGRQCVDRIAEQRQPPADVCGQRRCPKADATINAFQLSLTVYISSNVDGDVQSLPDPAAAAEDQQSA